MGNKHKLGFWVLTSLVVGNMVGSGIFMLPQSLAAVASPGGVILAWLFTGLGVLFVTLVFGNLGKRKPELQGGPQIYAKELFAKGSNAATLSGFMSTWGYWIGNLAGNIAIITTFAGYLSTFFPSLTSQVTLFTVGSFELKVGNALTFLVCSLMLWVTHFIVLRGVEGAGKLNLMATIAKVSGFILFIIIGLTAFEKSNIVPFIADQVTSSGQTVGLLGQVQSAAVITLWAFVGVESAVVFASRAKKQSDVKRATILGLLIALSLYIGISLLVMGILPNDALVHSDKPLIDAITLIMGPIGGKLIAALGLISLMGSTIGWVMLSAEVPSAAAKQRLFIPRFMQENKHGLPVFSLIITNILGQLFIFSTISSSISQAFQFVIYIATLSYLVPYVIASAFQLKLVYTGETYETGSNRFGDGIIGFIACAYSVYVLFAGTANIKTFIFGMLLLFSGVFFYKFVKDNEKEQLNVK
ncbi:amino acid permease [Bacillus sp. 1P06AnD]|uniref:amino acid permease n=1 Tax=Bacillus sp. 1P06AnD TaxID=3132208 RepID=UPI0039A18ABB